MVMVRERYPGLWYVYVSYRDPETRQPRQLLVDQMEFRPTPFQVARDVRKYYLKILAMDDDVPGHLLVLRDELVATIGEKTPKVFNGNQVNQVALYRTDPLLWERVYGSKKPRKAAERKREWTIDDAIKHAMHSVAGAKERWTARRREGRNNKELNKAIQYELCGECGGWSDPRGDCWFRRNPPGIWINRTGPCKGKPDIGGKALVDRVRALFRIPMPHEVLRPEEECEEDDCGQRAVTTVVLDDDIELRVCAACRDHYVGEGWTERTGTTRSSTSSPPAGEVPEVPALHREDLRYLRSVEGVGHRTVKELEDALATYADIAGWDNDLMAVRTSEGQRHRFPAIRAAARAADEAMKEALACHDIPEARFECAWRTIGLAILGHDYQVMLPRKRVAPGVSGEDADYLVDFVQGILSFVENDDLEDIIESLSKEVPMINPIKHLLMRGIPENRRKMKKFVNMYQIHYYRLNKYRAMEKIPHEQLGVIVAIDLFWPDIMKKLKVEHHFFNHLIEIYCNKIKTLYNDGSRDHYNYIHDSFSKYLDILLDKGLDPSTAINKDFSPYGKPIVNNLTYHLLLKYREYFVNQNYDFFNLLIARKNTDLFDNILILIDDSK